MGAARAAGVALVAMMAFAAVAQAQQPFPENSKFDKKGKEVIIIPKGTLFAGPPQGKPIPFQKKAVFVKNNTIIHREIVKEHLPKMKEEPIKDNTVKQPNLHFKPEVEFIKNNTIIHKQKVIMKEPKMKEEPIKDNTVKQPNLNFKPQVEFIKNNTIINKPKPVHPIKVKELPIEDITKPSKDLFEDVKKDNKDMFEREKDKVLSGGARRLSRRAL